MYNVAVLPTPESTVAGVRHRKGAAALPRKPSSRLAVRQDTAPEAAASMAVASENASAPAATQAPVAAPVPQSPSGARGGKRARPLEPNGRKRKLEEEGAHSGAAPGGTVSDAKGGKDGKKEPDKYCHFCQHVKVNMMACEAENCTHRFCTYCLTVHLGVDTDQKEAGVWHCPTCSGNCCCSGPECNKPHRHCKAFRYRQRRAAAATLRVSAANALVSLGFTLPAGKGKNKLVPTFDSGAHDHDKAERPAKRRESPLPGGPSEGGDESEDRLPRIGGTCEDQERAANQGEFESGESAVNLLASLGSGRSPSPTVNTQTDTSLTDGDRMKNDDAQIVNTDPAPGGSALEQLALLASHLAAVEPNGARSPPLASAPQVWRARSEDSLSAMSTLDTPRQSSEVETPVKVVSNSKMDIGELMTSPSSWVAKAPSLVSVVSLAQTAAPSPPTLSE